MRLKPAESRVAALLLLLVTLVIGYFVLVHWWFVAPQLQIASDMDDLRDTEQRYAAAIAERPVLEKRIAALSAGQTDSNAFLPEDDPNAAAAGLMQRVVDVAAAHQSTGPCEVVQKMPVPGQDKAGDPYRKVTVNISLRCYVEPMAAVLHDLENGMPYLFIEDFSAYRNPMAARSAVSTPLDVQFSVSGYVRQAVAASAAQGAKR
jgi:general secretion pathway protein M